MTTSKHVTDADLNAYVDGELDAGAQFEVADWLAANPRDAARVDAYRQQNEQLHNMFDPVADEPIPAPLSDVVAQARRRSRVPGWMRIAAAVALLLFGAAGGWGLRDLQDAPLIAGVPSFVDRAIGAHLVYVAEVLHPVEVAAEQEGHLVAWLSKRLGQPLRPPYLASSGYDLVGGRLLEESGLPAAQFMYEDNAGRRVTVYVRTADGSDTAFKFVGQGTVSAFYWVDSPFAYALTGEMPRQELLDIANLVYQDLVP